MKRIILSTLIIVCSLLFGVSGKVFAYDLQEVSIPPNTSDFVLGPGKIELFMDPGQTEKRDLIITNRLGKAMGFKVQIEDFQGTDDPQTPVSFLGDQKGLRSLKEDIKPEIKEFVLSNGQRMILPVEISIPADAEPGGRYAAILLSTNPSMVSPELGGEDKIAGGVHTIARLAALFFVRVRGPVNENGLLKNFTLSGNLSGFYEYGPINFNLLYQNQGTIHEIPYGLIEIKNILGRKVGEIEIDPYFAMPDSVRSRDVVWDTKWGLGRYDAKVLLNRGYGNIIDEKSLSFWIIPWKIILAGLVILVILVFGISKILGSFEFKITKKSDKKTT